MERILSFLRDLEQNNNKAWFDANRNRYLEVKAGFNTFVAKLIAGISEFDPTIKGIGVNDCTYRIYRDVRFSKNKLPYKTHFGAYIVRGGKKSGYSGYYFHVGTGTSEDTGHMLASGNYYTEPRVLKILREDIELGNGDFNDIVCNRSDHRMSLDRSQVLKRVPKEFPADSPNAEYLRLKNFCLLHNFDDNFLLSSKLLPETLDIFRTTKPFLDYVNRAIEYSREESLGEVDFL